MVIPESMQEYDDGEFWRQAALGAGGTGSVYADGGGIQLSQAQHVSLNATINNKNNNGKIMIII